MNRSELQRLSNARIREAKILFRANEFSGAYYLAGYALECALKSCFAKTVKRHDFPDKDRHTKVFTHKINTLVELSKLENELARAKQAIPGFESSWTVAMKWNEEARYKHWSKEEAEALLDAIQRRTNGVLPWIKRHW
jgi:hypothetical protein